MDLTTIAQDFLNAESPVDMEISLAALDGDKDRLIAALLAKVTAAAATDKVLERIAKSMDITKDNLDDLADEVQGLVNSFTDLDLAKDVIVKERDVAREERDAVAKERDAARAAAAEAERVRDIYKENCDTLRNGICGVLNTTEEFYGYAHWDKHLVERLEEFVEEKDCAAIAFYDGVVGALGLPPAVYTDEQIITAVRDAKNDAVLERDITVLYEKNFAAAGIPLGADIASHIASQVAAATAPLKAEVERLKEKAAVQDIIDGARATRFTEPLHAEIASLRSIIFAHETREILLKADLKRATDALATASKPAPEMASTNSRVPSMVNGSLAFGGGFRRQATMSLEPM